MKGCVPLNLGPSPKDYWKELGNAVGGFRGKPLSSALTRLGYPTPEQSIAGKKLIIWESAGVLCRVTLEVDSQNIVTGTQIDGNQTACVNWGQARNLMRF